MACATARSLVFPVRKNEFLLRNIVISGSCRGVRLGITHLFTVFVVGKTIVPRNGSLVCVCLTFVSRYGVWWIFVLDEGIDRSLTDGVGREWSGVEGSRWTAWGVVVIVVLGARFCPCNFFAYLIKLSK